MWTGARLLTVLPTHLVHASAPIGTHRRKAKAFGPVYIPVLRQWLLMVGALSGAGMRGRYSEIPQVVIRRPALPNPTAPGLPGARCSPCLRPALAHGKGAERQRLQGTSLDADLMRAAHQPELQH